MSSYEPPQDQAAAYHLGKLGAQLHAEREARARAEQTNAYLLGLLTEQHISPTSRDLSAASISRTKPDAELVQQLLDASEQRIEELQLELQLEKLKAGLDKGKDCSQTRATPSNMVLGRVVHPSSVEREATLLAERVPASRTTYSSSESKPVAPHQEKNTVVNSHGLSEATDIPTAEWMCPVEKDNPKPEHTEKMRFKSFFAPSSAAPAHPAENIAQQIPETQAMTSQTHPLLPIPPAVSVKSVSAAEFQDETTRFSRFEKDDPSRAPHSHGRPPPNYRPFHPGHFPHQPWAPRGPLQLPPRPPFPGTNLISYADLDRPVEPPLPLHEQPSSGYLDFDEHLYDEPSSSKVENTKTIAKATTPHQLLPNSHGLKQSIHARSPYWPGFKTMVHNFRHVDIAKIPSTDSIPNLLNQITRSYFLLSVTPPKKTVRVVSPTEVETSYALTLEFARGDIAAEFVRSAEDILQKVLGCGGGFNVTQRRDRPSPLLPREVGEAVWRCGASRTLVIEEPGAALRVPANLRYQIEHCRYTTGSRHGERGRGCAGECGGRLQDSPEFLQDGSIRLVFWDVRDATVAYKTWTMSPLFRHAEVSYERDVVLPELEEEEAEEGDSGVKKNTVEVVQGGDEKSDEDAKASGSEGKHIGTRGAITSNPSSVEIEIEKEEDEGYAAGSSEDMESSIILSPKSIFPPSQNHPDTSAHHHPGVGLSSNESNVDVEVDVETPTITDHRAVLNYGDASDDIEEGEIREPLATPTENSLSSGLLPPPPRTMTITSTSTLSIDHVPCDPFKDPTLQDRGPEKAVCGESEDVKGKAASQAGCVNLEGTGKLMGRSRWAAAS
ncbi:hypothetical protein SLS58_010147 [Diplodia intermedia]|uniref:Uncharacterized protein n=1 Tax=Diplodia intermedia TaxID=856260 RepID=A0ABR3T8S7_9PEZI